MELDVVKGGRYRILQDRPIIWVENEPFFADPPNKDCQTCCARIESESDARQCCCVSSGTDSEFGSGHEFDVGVRMRRRAWGRSRRGSSAFLGTLTLNIRTARILI
eukprot:4231790-Amphidinium_carterae.1